MRNKFVVVLRKKRILLNKISPFGVDFWSGDQHLKPCRSFLCSNSNITH